MLGVGDDSVCSSQSPNATQIAGVEASDATRGQVPLLRDHRQRAHLVLGDTAILEHPVKQLQVGQRTVSGQVAR